MKQLHIPLHAVILLLSLLIPLASLAYDFKVGSIYYDITNANAGTVSVTYRAHPDYNSYNGNIEIPAEVQYNNKTYTVTAIGFSAFYNSRALTSVTIPNTITYIGERAFSGCIWLSTIQLPNSVRGIYNDAFYDCTNLKSIDIPNPKAVIRSGAFRNCSNLTSITLPDSLTSVSSYVFQGCSKLTAVDIPLTVKSIGEYAFANTGLRSIIIPNSVTSIGSNAFSGLSGLKRAVYPNNLKDPFPVAYGSRASYNPQEAIIENGFLYGANKTSLLFAPLSLAGDYVFPQSVTTVDGLAFRNCENLTSVTIPATVKIFSGWALSDCPKLAKLIIEDSDELLDIESIPNSSITKLYIGRNWKGTNHNTFGYKITSLTIGSKVTALPQYAFDQCNSLKVATIPNSVKTIGERAFYCCKGLSSLNIPNSVTTIGKNAFVSCYKITSVSIPNSVASIGDYAFYDCTGLTSVTIGHSIAVDNSLTKIGNYAFAGCKNLMEVRSYIMSPMTVGTSVFSTETFKNGTLRIPVGTIDLYKSAGGWNQFTNIMEDRVITGVDEVTAGDSTVSVYNLGGLLLRRDCPREELSTLPHGVYIIVSGSTHTKIKI